MDINESSINKIRFLSDFHFDFKKGCEDLFFTYISESLEDGLLILAGDFYNNFKKTIKFIQKLESLKIQGFFVLGNHDYWSKGMYTYNEIIDFVSKKTIHHQYFKFLKTGIIHRIDDLVFIGDTGWTSFNNGVGKQNFDKRTIKLPEYEEVKNFSFKEISSYHIKWIKFAKSILSRYEKVIMVTHFPMFNNLSYLKFSKKSDLWWRSLVDIPNKYLNFWNIYGHTHNTNKMNNFVSSQMGYDNSSYFQFKTLQRLSYETKLVSLNNLMSLFYNSNIIKTNDENEIREIKERGYKRTSANKHVISAVVNDFESYISSVERILANEETRIYIGYICSFVVPFSTKKMIENAIQILKEGIQDIRTYMTAIIVTGYVWNNMIYELDFMRPLDDFDIIRLYLYFKTIKKHNIPIHLIRTIERHRKNKLVVNNVDVYIPVINDIFQLNKEDLEQFKQIDLNSIAIYNSNSIVVDVVNDDIPIKTIKSFNYEKYKEFGFESINKVKANAWTIVDQETVGVILNKKEYYGWGIWGVSVPSKYYKIISKYWQNVNLIDGDFIKIKTRFILRDAKIQTMKGFVYISWDNLYKKEINKKFKKSFDSLLADNNGFQVIMIFKSGHTLENKCVEVSLHEIPLPLTIKD